MPKSTTGISCFRQHYVQVFAVLLFLTGWLGTAPSVRAQQDLTWTYYTNGAQVNDIAQDGTTLWIATNGGLVQFDTSTEQKTFYNVGNSALTENDILSVVVDADGTVWAGTDGGGLVMYDGSSWKRFDNSNSIIPSNVIRDLKVDANGTIWAALYNDTAFDDEAGILRINTQSGQVDFSIIELNAAGSSSNSVASVAIDSNGIIWAGTDGNGLMKYDNGTRTFFTSDNSSLPANNEIIDILVAPDNTVWLATDLGDLVHFNGTDTFTVYDPNSSGLPHRAVSLDMDAGGTLWIATDGAGLATFDGSTFSQYMADTNGMYDNTMHKVFLSDAGAVWAGMEKHGLAQFDVQGSAWTRYSTSNSGLPQGVEIGEMLHDSQGNLWITTDPETGVFRYDGTNWSTFNTGNSNLHDDRVNQLVEDQNGNIWMGTDYGISVYDGSSWTTQNGYLDLSINYSALEDMTVDADNNIWIAPGYSGIIKYDGTGWTQYLPGNSSIPSDNVTALFVDHNGNLWIAYNDYSASGLAKFDGSTWTDYPAGDYNLVDFEIDDITEDANGTLWLGSYYDAIYSFDGSSFVEYNSDNTALTASRVHNLEFDASGNLWMVFANYMGSVAKFDGKQFSVYTPDNAPLSDAFINSLVIDDNGTKWMGNEYGELIKLEGGSAPVADFTADIRSGAAPLTVTFTDLTGSVTGTRNWTFSGGNPANSTEANPSVTYETAGTYAVTLEVSNANGSDTETKSGFITVREAGTPADTDWLNYTNGTVVNAVAQEGTSMWLATNGGLTRLNGLTDEATVFNRANSGLPDNHIKDVVVDGNGRKWIATDKGLVMYNGTDWQVMNTDNSDIPANQVTTLALDASDQLYLGTVSGMNFASGNQGLIRYDGSSFTVVTASFPSEGKINDIAVSPAGDVWIALDGNGVTHYDGSGVETFNSSNSNLPQDYVNAIALDSDGMPWAGTGSGLAYYSGSSWSVKDFTIDNLQVSLSIEDLAFDVFNELWIGSVNHGLINMQGSQYTVHNADNSKLATDNIHTVYIDNNGRLWLGAVYSTILNDTSEKSALIEYDGSDWNMHPTSNSGLPSNTVSNIVIDHYGNVWMDADSQLGVFGGNDAPGGLVKFNGTSWTAYDNTNSPLPDANISALAVDTDNNLWVGTGKGLAMFDGTRWTLYDQAAMGIGEDAVGDMAIDDSGLIWLTIEGFGVVTFDGSTWTTYPSDSTPLPLNGLSVIEPGAGGTAWVGTAANGLFHYDGSSWTNYTSSNSNLPFDNITSLFLDPQGKLWIGSSSYTDAGLTVYDGSTWNPVGIRDGMGEVNDITMDASGVLWLAIGNGFSTTGSLAYYDGNQPTVLDINNSRLPSEDVKSVTVDSHGRVWVGTHDGGTAVYQGGGLPTDIDEETPVNHDRPNALTLDQNYPNPFNPSTNIRYGLPAATRVELSVYDVLGRRVAQLVSGRQTAGYHTVRFDASRLASGIYIYRIKTANTVKIHKMLLIK